MTRDGGMLMMEDRKLAIRLQRRAAAENRQIVKRFFAAGRFPGG